MNKINNPNLKILRKIIKYNPLFLDSKELKDQLVERAVYHILVRDGYAYIDVNGKHHLTEKGEDMLEREKVYRIALKIRKFFFPVKKLIHSIKMYFKN